MSLTKLVRSNERQPFFESRGQGRGRPTEESDDPGVRRNSDPRKYHLQKELGRRESGEDQILEG